MHCILLQIKLKNTLCNADQQNAHFYLFFNMITVSSTCFEYPSVHPQEDMYMQFYGISFMRPYKQCARISTTKDTV